MKPRKWKGSLESDGISRILGMRTTSPLSVFRRLWPRWRCHASGIWFNEHRYRPEVIQYSCSTRTFISSLSQPNFLYSICWADWFWYLVVRESLARFTKTTQHNFLTMPRRIWLGSALASDHRPCGILTLGWGISTSAWCWPQWLIKNMLLHVATLGIWVDYQFILINA